jgi:hypothetical protein
MALYQIRIKNEDFQKAIQIEEVKEFILQIEQCYLNPDATEEDLKSIANEVVKYQDDAEFDIDTLKRVLDKFHIESEIVLLSNDE